MSPIIDSHETSTHGPTTPWIRWLAIVAILLIACGFLFPIVDRPPLERRNRTRTDVINLAAAIRQFTTEYGLPPSGSQAEIMNALFGDNARKIMFFETNPKWISPAGEFLDPWGTPYRIDLSDPVKPKVYSCGKDKHDDGGADHSDDIRNW
jgi:hypothetical protein